MHLYTRVAICSLKSLSSGLIIPMSSLSIRSKIVMVFELLWKSNLPGNSMTLKLGYDALIWDRQKWQADSYFLIDTHQLRTIYFNQIRLFINSINLDFVKSRILRQQRPFVEFSTLVQELKSDWWYAIQEVLQHKRFIGALQKLVIHKTLTLSVLGFWVENLDDIR